MPPTREKEFLALYARHTSDFAYPIDDKENPKRLYYKVPFYHIPKDMSGKREARYDEGRKAPIVIDMDDDEETIQRAIAASRRDELADAINQHTKQTATASTSSSSSVPMRVSDIAEQMQRFEQKKRTAPTVILLDSDEDIPDEEETAEESTEEELAQAIAMSLDTSEVAMVVADPLPMEERKVQVTEYDSEVSDADETDTNNGLVAIPLGYTSSSYADIAYHEAAHTLLKKFDKRMMGELTPFYNLGIYQRHTLHDGDQILLPKRGDETREYRALNKATSKFLRERYDAINELPIMPNPSFTLPTTDGSVVMQQEKIVALFHPLEPSSKLLYRQVKQLAMEADGIFEAVTSLSGSPYTEWRVTETLRNYQLQYEIFETMYLHLIALSHAPLFYDHFIIDVMKVVPMTQVFADANQQLCAMLPHDPEDLEATFGYVLPPVPAILSNPDLGKLSSYTYTPVHPDDMAKALEAIYKKTPGGMNKMKARDRAAALVYMRDMYTAKWNFVTALCHHLCLINLILEQFAALPKTQIEAAAQFERCFHYLNSVVYGDLECRSYYVDSPDNDVIHLLNTFEKMTDDFVTLMTNNGITGDTEHSDDMSRAEKSRSARATLTESDHEGQANALELNLVLLHERKPLSGADDRYINTWADIVRVIRMTGPEGVIDLEELFAENRLLDAKGAQRNVQSPYVMPEASQREKTEAGARDFMELATKFIGILEQRDCKSVKLGYNANAIDTFFATIILRSDGRYRSYEAFKIEGQAKWLNNTLVDPTIDAGAYYNYMLADYLARLRDKAYKPTTAQLNLMGDSPEIGEYLTEQEYTAPPVKKTMIARYYEVHFINPLPYSRTGKVVVQYVPFVEDEVKEYMRLRHDRSKLVRNPVAVQIHLLQQHILRSCILYFVRTSIRSIGLPPPEFWGLEEVHDFMRKWNMQPLLLADMRDTLNLPDDLDPTAPDTESKQVTFFSRIRAKLSKAIEYKAPPSNPETFQDILKHYAWTGEHIRVSYGFFNAVRDVRLSENIRIAEMPSVGDERLLTCTVEEFAYRMAQLIEPCDYFPPDPLQCTVNTFQLNQQTDAYIHAANVYLMKFFLPHNQARKQQFDQTNQPLVVLQEMFQDEVLKDFHAERVYSALVGQVQFRYNRVYQGSVEKLSVKPILTSRVDILRCAVCDRLYWFYHELRVRVHLLDNMQHVTLFCGGDMCALMGPIDTVLESIFDLRQEDTLSVEPDLLPDKVLRAFPLDPGGGEGKDSNPRWTYFRKKAQSLVYESEAGAIATASEITDALLNKVFNKIGKYAIAFIMLQFISRRFDQDKDTRKMAVHNSFLQTCNNFLDEYLYTDAVILSTKNPGGEELQEATKVFQALKAMLHRCLIIHDNPFKDATDQIKVFAKTCNEFKASGFFSVLTDEKENGVSVIESFSQMAIRGARWLGKLLLTMPSELGPAVLLQRLSETVSGELDKQLDKAKVVVAKARPQDDHLLNSVQLVPDSLQIGNGAFAMASSTHALERLSSEGAAFKAIGDVALRTVLEIGAAYKHAEVVIGKDGRLTLPKEENDEEDSVFKRATQFFESITDARNLSFISTSLLSYTNTNTTLLQHEFKMGSSVGEQFLRLFVGRIASLDEVAGMMGNTDAQPGPAFLDNSTQGLLTASQSNRDILDTAPVPRMITMLTDRKHIEAVAPKSLEIGKITATDLLLVELANSDRLERATNAVLERSLVYSKGGQITRRDAVKALGGLLDLVDQTNAKIPQKYKDAITKITPKTAGPRYAAEKAAAINNMALVGLQCATGLPGVMEFQAKNYNANIEFATRRNTGNDDEDIIGKNTMTIFTDIEAEIEAEQGGDELKKKETADPLKDQDDEYANTVEVASFTETLRGSLKYERDMLYHNKPKAHRSNVELSPLFAEMRDMDLQELVDKITEIATTARKVNMYEDVLLELPHVRQRVLPVHPNAGSFTNFTKRDAYIKGMYQGGASSLNPFATTATFISLGRRPTSPDYLFAQQRFTVDIDLALGVRDASRVQETLAQVKLKYAAWRKPRFERAQASYAGRLAKYKRVCDLIRERQKKRGLGKDPKQDRDEAKILRSPPQIESCPLFDTKLGELAGRTPRDDAKDSIEEYFVIGHMQRFDAASRLWAAPGTVVRDIAYVDKKQGEAKYPRVTIIDFLYKVMTEPWEGPVDRGLINKQALHTTQLVDTLFHYFSDMTSTEPQQRAASFLTHEDTFSATYQDLQNAQDAYDSIARDALEIFAKYFGQLLAYNMSKRLYDDWVPTQKNPGSRKKAIAITTHKLIDTMMKKMNTTHATKAQVIAMLSTNLEGWEELRASDLWKGVVLKTVEQVLNMYKNKTRPGLDTSQSFEVLFTLACQEVDHISGSNMIPEAWTSTFHLVPIDETYDAHHTTTELSEAAVHLTGAYHSLEQAKHDKRRIDERTRNSMQAEREQKYSDQIRVHDADLFDDEEMDAQKKMAAADEFWKVHTNDKIPSNPNLSVAKKPTVQRDFAQRQADANKYREFIDLDLAEANQKASGPTLQVAADIFNTISNRIATAKDIQTQTAATSHRSRYMVLQEIAARIAQAELIPEHQRTPTEASFVAFGGKVNVQVPTVILPHVAQHRLPDLNLLLTYILSHSFGPLMSRKLHDLLTEEDARLKELHWFECRVPRAIINQKDAIIAQGRDVKEKSDRQVARALKRKWANERKRKRAEKKPVTDMDEEAPETDNEEDEKEEREVDSDAEDEAQLKESAELLAQVTEESKERREMDKRLEQIKKHLAEKQQERKARSERKTSAKRQKTEDNETFAQIRKRKKEVAEARTKAKLADNEARKAVKHWEAISMTLHKTTLALGKLENTIAVFKPTNRSATELKDLVQQRQELQSTINETRAMSISAHNDVIRLQKMANDAKQDADDLKMMLEDDLPADEEMLDKGDPMVESRYLLQRTGAVYDSSKRGRIPCTYARTTAAA